MHLFTNKSEKYRYMAAKNTEGPTSRTSLENPITGQGSKHGLKVLKGGGASEGLTVARKSKVTAKVKINASVISL